MDYTIAQLKEAGRQLEAFHYAMHRMRLIGMVNCIVVEFKRVRLSTETVKYTVLRGKNCALCSSS